MTTEYRVGMGDMLDLIAWRALGGERACAALLDANPALERFGALDRLEPGRLIMPARAPAVFAPRFDPW